MVEVEHFFKKMSVNGNCNGMYFLIIKTNIFVNVFMMNIGVFPLPFCLFLSF